MKVTFSGTAEEILAAICTIAQLGQVPSEGQELLDLAERAARALADKAEPTPAEPEETQRTIKREDVRLEVGDEVTHGSVGWWFSDYFAVDLVGDESFDYPVHAAVWMSFTGVTNIPDQVPPVTHFRRNGITYTIED